MITQELIQFIKDQLAVGKTRAQIEQELQTQGWTSVDTSEAFAYITPTQKSSGWPKILIGVIVLAGIGYTGWWFYQSKIHNQNPSSQYPFVEKATEDISTEHPNTEMVDQTEQKSSQIDCGTDYSCFIKAGQNCSPATVLSTQSIENNSTITRLAIKKEGRDSCNLYIRNEKIVVTPPPGQIMPPEVTAMFKKLEGRDGNCVFKTSDLAVNLEKWRVGSFDTGETSCKLGVDGNVCTTVGGDFAKGVCTGSYFSHEI